MIDQFQLQINFLLTCISFHVSNNGIRSVIAIATNFVILLLKIAVFANNNRKNKRIDGTWMILRGDQHYLLNANIVGPVAKFFGCALLISLALPIS